jgi:hypothetical protein
LIAIIFAVSKWRHYLEQGPFIVKTDHESIKHLLEQRLHTCIQQKGITKLLGLDYCIQYKKGTENKVADALSRRQDEGELLFIRTASTLVPTWTQEIIDSYQGDSHIVQLI